MFVQIDVARDDAPDEIIQVASVTAMDTAIDRIVDGCPDDATWEIRASVHFHRPAELCRPLCLPSTEVIVLTPGIVARVADEPDDLAWEAHIGTELAVINDVPDRIR
jgi:hypothetical protein